MTRRIVEHLLRLSGRERLLLALMLLVAAVGLGAGLLWPLAERRAAAETALAEARALELWVAARSEEAAMLRAAAGPGPVAPIGLAAVQRSLEQARLIDSVETLSAFRGDGIELRLDAVGFDRLIAWVTQVEPVWGYRFASFRIERGPEPGLVNARFEVLPNG